MHLFVIELGEDASIKTKCFPIRADEGRLFNLIASRFIDPVGAWGDNTKTKWMPLRSRRCVSVAGKHHHGGEYQAGSDE